METLFDLIFSTRFLIGFVCGGLLGMAAAAFASRRDDDNDENPWL